MNSEGFTEDDQARIAEEVLGRVGAKRTGLGFSGGGGVPAQPAKSAASAASSSAWFEQRAESAATEKYAFKGESRDPTEGPFAWDGGQRGKSGGAGRRKDDRSNNGGASRETNNDLPVEREFPMVRDRDLEKMKRGDGDRGSRRRGRSRSRSRSRSRDRRRRERQREGERERDRQRQRQRERERERERAREWERERYRRNRTSSGSRDRERRQRPYKEAGKAAAAPVTAEQAKAALKRRLRHVAAADTTLKTGAKATVGGGMGWERPEMSTVADYFQNDEVAAKGGVASVAVEYEARLAEILAVEDEDVTSLGDQKVQPSSAAGKTGPSTLEQKHHDAIFAPAGTPPEPQPDVPRAAPKGRSVGGLGAAARARLALTGKLGEELTAATPKATPTTAKKAAKGSEKRPQQPREDDSDKPLFKTLRAGEAVEAQFTEDDKWYKAFILQVIHGGYSNAVYKVRYSEYGNEETVAWTRIKKLKSAEPPAPSSQPPVAPKMPASPERAEPPAPAEDATPPFAGMRPRAMCVENYAPPKAQASKGEGDDAAQAAADVVNPVLLSAAPTGRKLSWKEKLAARKKAGGAGKGDGGGGVNVLPKEVSLVQDFAAQRREREQAADRKMDKSEWRTRVAFGIGNAKRPAS